MGFHHEELYRLWNILNIRPSKSFHKNFKKVQQKLNSAKVKDVTAPLQPLFPGELDPARQPYFDKAEADLNDEKSILFEKLKYELPDDEQIKIFKSFHVDVVEKQKKLRVTQYLWEIRKFAKPSAEFVISMRRVAEPVVSRGFMPCPANERAPVNRRLIEDGPEDEAASQFFDTKYVSLLEKHVAASQRDRVTATRNQGPYVYAEDEIVYHTRRSYAYNFDPEHFAAISKWIKRRELIRKFLAAEL